MNAAAAQWKLHAVGLALLGGMLAGAFMVAVRPIQRQREQADRLLDAHAQLQAEIDDVRGVERDLRDELARLGALGAGWEARRGESRTLNERLADIAVVAERNGVRVHTLRPGTAQKGSFFTITPVAIVGEAGYAQCAAFVRDLLEHLPDVTIEALELRAVRSENGEATGGLTLGLAWYADSDGTRPPSTLQPG